MERNKHCEERVQHREEQSKKDRDKDKHKGGRK